MDREKVIAVLLDIKIYLLQGKMICTSDKGKSIAQERINGIDDAIALLKEREAVKPKSKVRHGANAQIQHFCGNCNSMLHGKPKFCSECGRGVLW